MAIGSQEGGLTNPVSSVHTLQHNSMPYRIEADTPCPGSFWSLHEPSPDLQKWQSLGFWCKRGTKSLHSRSHDELSVHRSCTSFWYSSRMESLQVFTYKQSGPIRPYPFSEFGQVCSQFVGAVTFRCTWATPQPTPPTTIAAPPRTPAPQCTTRATPRNWLPFSEHPVTSCGLLWGCPLWTPLGCLSQSITGLSGSIPCLCCAPRESRNSKNEPGHTKIWLSWSSRWGVACKQPASLPIRRLSNRLPFFVNQGAATDATAWQASSITCNVTEIQTKSLEEAACPTRPPTQKGKVYLKAETHWEVQLHNCMQEKLSEQPRTVNWCGHLELTGSMLDQLLIAVQAQAKYCGIQL